MHYNLKSYASQCNIYMYIFFRIYCMCANLFDACLYTHTLIIYRDPIQKDTQNVAMNST